MAIFPGGLGLVGYSLTPYVYIQRTANIAEHYQRHMNWALL